MIKIAFLSRYQQRSSRGAEVFVNELSSRLTNKFQVDILSGADSDRWDKLVGGGFKVVVPINGGMQSLKASLGRRWGGYKLLITGHAGLGRDDIWNLAIARPDVFVVPTEHALNNWRTKLAHLFSWQSQLIKIPNGVDLEKFKSNGHKFKIDLPRPIILSVGALVWYKYHDRVIEAVAQLNQGSLVIVGLGPDQDKLSKLAAQKLPGRFKIVSLSYDQMPKIYRSADLFTLPSWEREAFGIVYLEAMAAGLPVVAPEDQSKREIIEKAGLFTQVADPVQYAQAIKQALRTNWGNKPRQQANKFSWERVTSRYEQIFIKLSQN